MNHLLILSTLMVFVTVSQSIAQIGKYVKESKEKTEIIELLPDRTYMYTIKTEWSSTKCSGAWKEQDGHVFLNSKYQLNDFVVNESREEEGDAKVRIMVRGEMKGQAPKKIHKIYINAKDSIFCPMDSERVLAFYEEKQKIKTGGTPEERAKLAKASLKHFYWTDQPAEVNHIKIHFGNDQLIEYVPEDKDANNFEIVTKLAKDPLYQYFQDEAFLLSKKNLLQLANQESFKKVKK
ncbi:MAG: hypothetical protein MK212_18275 [Saprospiraceae bacterium]|nr:hypothetical protein [Saprospiraceae bacterium]